jgi:hypothetical protein
MHRPKTCFTTINACRADGRGVDVAIEALGTQNTFESALRVLRPGGILSSLGVYSGDLRIPLGAFVSRDKENCPLGDTRICPLVAEESVHGQRTNRGKPIAMSRLKKWMPRFNDVATKYLSNYLGWLLTLAHLMRPSALSDTHFRWASGFIPQGTHGGAIEIKYAADALGVDGMGFGAMAPRRSRCGRLQPEGNEAEQFGLRAAGGERDTDTAGGLDEASGHLQ